MFENVDGRTDDGRTTDGRRTDGRTTDARVTGILIAHLGAFGSGELKRGYDKTSLLSYLCSPIASLDMILSFKLKTKALRLRGCGLCPKYIYLTFKRFTNSPFIKALSSNAPFVFFHTN